jgi:hypothetical protein
VRTTRAKWIKNTIFVRNQVKVISATKFGANNTGNMDKNTIFVRDQVKVICALVRTTVAKLIKNSIFVRDVFFHIRFLKPF